jgi:cardiolipin synthase A/B
MTETADPAASPAPPRMAGPDGPVPARAAREVLEDLEQASGAHDLLHAHLLREQSLAGGPLVLGNRVQLLMDGPQTYAAMFRAIGAARDHVNLETYIISDDEVGNRFAQTLLERQAAGVQVNLVYDSVGCLTTPRAWFDRLRARGVRVLEYNPVNPLQAKRRPWVLNARDHRKLLVVDGRTAFLGGININESYSSGSSAPAAAGRVARASARLRGGLPGSQGTDTGWRDTHLQVEGPAVAEFQRLFLATWERQGGAPLPPRTYFPPLEACGVDIVRAIASHAEQDDSPIYRAVESAIRHAATRVWITNAYFVPDPRLRAALCTAAKRGADVRIILPSRTDSALVFHAGRSHYCGLLESGVRIYERQGPVVHCKTATVDGVWSTVGSSNLDWRSLLYNDEVNAVVLGREFATEMEAMYRHDLGHSREVTIAAWRSRPLRWRCCEGGARLLERWL